jgi:hypothetical protein
MVYTILNSSKSKNVKKHEKAKIVGVLSNQVMLIAVRHPI